MKRVTVVLLVWLIVFSWASLQPASAQETETPTPTITETPTPTITPTPDLLLVMTLSPAGRSVAVNFTMSAGEIMLVVIGFLNLGLLALIAFSVLGQRGDKKP